MTCLQFRCSLYTSLSQDEPNSLLSIPSSLQIAGINVIVNNPASPALCKQVKGYLQNPV